MDPRVVVIDSEAHVTRVIALKLMRADFQVHTAATAEIGWRLIERDEPSLIILGTSLPENTSEELFNRIRQDVRTADTPVILLTSHVGEIGFDTWTPNEAPTEVLAKPFSPRALLEICCEHVNCPVTTVGWAH